MRGMSRRRLLVASDHWFFISRCILLWRSNESREQPARKVCLENDEAEGKNDL